MSLESACLINNDHLSIIFDKTKGSGVGDMFGQVCQFSDRSLKKKPKTLFVFPEFYIAPEVYLKWEKHSLIIFLGNLPTFRRPKTNDDVTNLKKTNNLRTYRSLFI